MLNITHVQDAAQALTDAKRNYLTQHGWQQTCNTPGSYWLWVRDFSDLDAQRLAWWEKANGPLGKPSKPHPYGRITAEMDMAVAMTRATLEDPKAEEMAGDKED